jgi:hypothetical protein
VKDFPKATKITMLWMPTHSGSAKKHLALTQTERLNALGVFSEKLMQEIGVPKLTIKPSDIEYKIYFDSGRTRAYEVGKDYKEGTGDTATVFTLRKLKEIYPAARLTLTMGLDNLFELPYWYLSTTYPDYAKDIYITDRAITPEDESRTTEIDHDGMKLRFVTKPPYGNGTIALFTPYLDKFRFHMLGQPPNTSSSLLRIAHIKYYGRPEIAAVADVMDGDVIKIKGHGVWPKIVGDGKYKEHVENLQLISVAAPESTYWQQMHEKENHLELPSKIASFDEDYGNAFPLGGAKAKGGYRRSRNRKNRKQKTRNNRRSRSNRRSRNNRN